MKMNADHKRTRLTAATRKNTHLSAGQTCGCTPRRAWFGCTEKHGHMEPYTCIVGVLILLNFSNSSVSVCGKDWRCRKHVMQAT